MLFLTERFFDLLLFFYTTTSNLGVAIIVFTLLLRLLLVPLTLPSLKARNKIQELQPELQKLKNKFKNDKTGLQKAQLELYQRYNVNPLSGCLPQIVQLAVLIFLYQALISFLGKPEINGTIISPNFLWLNLAQPDGTFTLPVLAGLTQLVLSLMITPGGEVRDIVPNKAKNKKIQVENKKEEDMADMAATMQKQMLFVMPIMTGVIAVQFPSGLALYWVITTVFSIVQQYFLSGLGGLKTYYLRALVLLSRFQKGF